MNSRISIALCLAAGVFAWGCGNRNTGSTAGSSNESSVSVESAGGSAPLVAIPTPPAMLGAGLERTGYILERYWKGLDWNDTTVIGSDALAQAFGVWAQILMSLPEPEAARYSRHIISAGHGHPQMQTQLYDLAQELLNDPNSPYRNEELFLPVLEAFATDSGIPATDRLRPQYLLEQLSKNRKGTRAAELTITKADGSTVQLYKWISASNSKGQGDGVTDPLILLYFFNPDCHDCERVGAILTGDPSITVPVAQGKLRIAAIYPDKDLESWNAHKSDAYPATWLVGRLATDAQRDRYYLPAIPNLYLLDSKGVILLKDAPIESVIDFIR